MFLCDNITALERAVVPDVNKIIFALSLSISRFKNSLFPFKNSFSPIFIISFIVLKDLAFLCNANICQSDFTIESLGTIDRIKIDKNNCCFFFKKSDITTDYGNKIAKECQNDIDLDFNNKRIIVCGKGNKERIVYYGDYAEEVLLKYLKTHIRKDNNYLFLNSKGEQITDGGIRYIIDNIMKKLSIKVHVTPHVLRHTFATDMLNNGCDIKVVQELLGHSSLKATEIYTHVTNEHLKEVYYKCFPRRDKDE